MAALVAGALLVVAPASAEHRRHSRFPYPPRVSVFVGLPLPPIPIPVVVVPGRGGYYGPPAPYYGGYGYDDGYDDRYGYDDGYRGRGRSEWRRRHYRGHHDHGDCDY
jgi:hypothetical protein